MIESCAITGHRPVRFKFKYNEAHSECKRLKMRLRNEIMRLYGHGVRHFWVGGALGVDMWAGEILLRLKERHDYEDIRIMLALPVEGHDVRWDKRSRERMDFIRSHSDKTVTIGSAKQKASDNYLRRYKMMIEWCDCLLAVYDNNRVIRSETGIAVRFAERKRLPIVLIHPDTGVATYQNGMWTNKVVSSDDVLQIRYHARGKEKLKD